MAPDSWPNLGYGVGLRSAHYDQILKEWPKTIEWFENKGLNKLKEDSRACEFTYDFAEFVKKERSGRVTILFVAMRPERFDY